MRLKTVREAAPEIDAAVRQVLAYCQSRGVPFAAVSNGHQLIAFLASRQDAVPPLEGRALVFASLEAMRADFKTLWDTVSRDGAEEQNLVQIVGDTTVVPPPPNSPHGSRTIRATGVATESRPALRFSETSFCSTSLARLSSKTIFWRGATRQIRPSRSTRCSAATSSKLAMRHLPQRTRQLHQYRHERKTASPGISIGRSRRKPRATTTSPLRRRRRRQIHFHPALPPH